MKQCKKCNKTFDDNMDYCPHCGSMLELSEDSAAFRRIEALRKEQEQLERRDKFRNAVTLTEKILYLAFPLLYMVGLFLPIVYYYTTSAGETNEVIVSAMTYLISLFTSDFTPTIASIVNLIIIGIALVIVIIGGAISVILNATSTANKEDKAKSKFAVLTGFGYFTLAFALRATICGAVGKNPGMSDAPYSSHFGVFVILMGVLTFLAIVAVFVLRYINTHPEYSTRIVFALILKFLGFLASLWLTNAIMGSILEDANTQGEFNYLLLSKLTPDNGSVDLLLVFSVVFTLYSMFATFFKIYHPLDINLPTSITVSIVQAYLGIMLYILTYVLLSSTADGKSYLFSDNFYSLLPLSIFTLLFTLVADILVLSKRSELKEREKNALNAQTETTETK